MTITKHVFQISRSFKCNGHKICIFEENASNFSEPIRSGYPGKNLANVTSPTPRPWWVSKMTFRMKVQSKSSFLYNAVLFNSGIIPPRKEALSSLVSKVIYGRIELSLLELKLDKAQISHSQKGIKVQVGVGVWGKDGIGKTSGHFLECTTYLACAILPRETVKILKTSKCAAFPPCLNVMGWRRKVKLPSSSEPASLRTPSGLALSHCKMHSYSLLCPASK